MSISKHADKIGNLKTSKAEIYKITEEFYKERWIGQSHGRYQKFKM